MMRTRDQRKGKAGLGGSVLLRGRAKDLEMTALIASPKGRTGIANGKINYLGWEKLVPNKEQLTLGVISDIS